MAIRPLYSTDLDALLLLEQGSRPNDGWSRQLFIDQLWHPYSHQWLMEDDHQAVVGYLIALLIPGVEGQLINLLIAPTARRQGLASSLHDQLTSTARDLNIPELQLEVRVDNHAAIRLYEQLGYVPVGCRPNYYQHPSADALLMCLHLSK